jgi:hypothetical protein
MVGMRHDEPPPMTTGHAPRRDRPNTTATVKRVMTMPPTDASNHREIPVLEISSWMNRTPELRKASRRSATMSASHRW